jgi:multiple sugar transport system ATP-binding protein
MAEIRANAISKRFGRHTVFQNLSLTCPDHAYMCLVGPSGCGKTTLMRMIAGLTQPDEGDIFIGRARVNDLPPVDRKIGLAFQNYALYPHLTVAGNLAFPLRAPVRRGRFSSTDIDTAVRRVAALMKIEPLMERRVNQLSGGQQQRVALGRALIHDPEVLLLDEPVTHLDARLRYEMRAEIKILHQRLETTTIHVTHDQSEALAMADLIAVMNEGRIEQFGSPKELYENPASAFVAGFVGDPPMSLVPAHLESAGGAAHIRIGDSDLILPETLMEMARRAKSRDVLIGLRPQYVRTTAVGEGDLNADIYSHEMVGRGQQVILSVGASQLRCRENATQKVTAGIAVGVKLSLEKALLFDGSSQMSLARESAHQAS